MNLLEELKKYCEDCISDKIISCRKHKWSCIRFLKDLEKEKDLSYPYYFDIDKANKFIKWTSEFKHTKGSKAVVGKTFLLPIYLKFMCSNIYGWYNKKDGSRRFSKMYLQVARKNAKSQILSMMALYEWCIYLGNNSLSEVYCAATKKDQAKIVFDESKRMLKQLDFMSGKWDYSYQKLIYLQNESVISTMSKDDKKNADGYNPQCAIIDEYHAHETSEILDILDSGMGARSDPLLAIITTAGFDLNTPCFKIEYNLAEKVLNPESSVNIESTFYDIFELETNTTSEEIILDDGTKVPPYGLIDNPYDENNWAKANPISNDYEGGRDNFFKYLRKKSEESKQAPEKERNFLTKHMNMWVNRRDSGYMDLSRWNGCKGEIPDLKNISCYAGLDLSAKLDLTSAGLILPFNGKYIILGMSFIPEDKFYEHLKTDRSAQYDLWLKQGWIKLTSGSTVDYRSVVDWVKEKAEELGFYLCEWCVDPWGATQITADLIEEGHKVVDIIQET